MWRFFAGTEEGHFLVIADDRVLEKGQGAAPRQVVPGLPVGRAMR
jgi:hypothetical protein